MRGQAIPQAAKFFLGFSITPFVIGTYMMLISFLRFADNRVARVFIPYAFALVVLFYKRKKVLKAYRSAFLALRRMDSFVREMLIAFLPLLICYGVFRIETDLRKGLAVQRLLPYLAGVAAYAFLRYGEKRLRHAVWSPVDTKKTMTMTVFMLVCILFWHWCIDNTIKKVFVFGALLSGILAYAVVNTLWNAEWNEQRKPKTTITTVFKRKLYIWGAGWIGAAVILLYPYARQIASKAVIGGYLKKYFKSSIALGIVLAFIGACAIAAFFVSEHLFHKKLYNTCTDSSQKKRLWRKAATVVILFVGVWFCDSLFRASYAPVIGSDAVEYLGQALRFAQDGSAASMTTFVDAADGSTLMCTHNFAWPAYLANALLHSSTLGYPSDYAVRLAFQMTYLYFFAAVIGCGQLLFKKNQYFYSFLTIVVCLQCNAFGFTFEQGSRDIFRLIPLLGLFCVVYGMGKAVSKEKCLHFSGTFFMPFWFGYCTMAGHPINAFTAIAVVGAVFVIQTLNKEWRIGQFVGYGATALGGATGSYMMLWALLTTGSLSGNRGDLPTILAGSPYLLNYLKYQQGRLKSSVSYPAQVGSILARNNIVLSVLGILCAVGLLILFFKNRKQGRVAEPTAAMGLACLLNLFMLNNVVSWGGEKMSEWLTMNQRYTIQISMLMAFSVVLLLPWITGEWSEKGKGTWRRVKNATLYAALCFMLLSPVMYYPGYDFVGRRTKWLEGTQAANAAFVGERFLMDNYCTNYYLYNRAVSMFTEFAEPCLTAPTSEALEAAMKDMDLKGGLLKTSYESVYWNDTPLEQLLYSDRVEIVFKDDQFIVFQWNNV